MESIELMKIAVKGADDKKALDIKALNITELTTLADYFVICHANSSLQMGAIFDSIEEKLKEEGVFLLNAGSKDSGQWMLMDYGDVIVTIEEYDHEINLKNGNKRFKRMEAQKKAEKILASRYP